MNSIDFEGALVLGGCLYPKDFPISVRSEHFEISIYREIWKMLENLNSKGQEWDLPILYHNGGDDIKRWVRDVNGDLFVPKTLLPRYADIIKNAYLSRVSLKTMKEVEQDLGHVDPFEFQSRLSQKLAEDDVGSSTISMKDAAKQVFNRLEKAQQEGEITGITTGIRNLDVYFNGFQPSKLYILAARPSMGKSALMLNFALNAAKSGATVYCHCLEESLLAFTTRALANLGAIDNNSLQRGRLNMSQWDKVSGGLSRLSELPFFVNEQSGITPEKICQSVRTQNLKTPIDIVFIDHLQDIKRKSDSWHHDTSEAVGLFKQLSKDLKIPVLVVSQLNRAVEMTKDKRPMLSNLKESGDIEAKADVIMLLYRESYYNPISSDPNHADVTIAKNRDGKTGIFPLHWNADYMRFYERDGVYENVKKQEKPQAPQPFQKTIFQSDIAEDPFL